MKTAIIIPIHKQARNVERILHGLSIQTKKDFIVYLMLDRPESNDIDTITEHTKKFDLDIRMHVISEFPYGINNRVGGEVFLTPYIRNEGIELAKDDNVELFIFIDGDCVPQENLVKAHQYTSSMGLPVLSVARRREEGHMWKDQREIDRNISYLNLFRREGMVINNLQMLKSSMIVWSCNISINRAGIRLMEKFNKYYYNKRETFSSLFYGTWGGEDGFLGIEAYYAGLYINMIGDTQAGIKHIDHPRPKDTYGHQEHTQFLNKTIKELGEMMIRRPLKLEFFRD